MSSAFAFESMDDMRRAFSNSPYVRYLTGRGPGNPMQTGLATGTYQTLNAIPGVSRGVAGNVGRFAGRAIPLVSAIANVGDVADVIAGPNSLGNKAMDATAMTIGGILGAGGGPLGVSLGATSGKAVSDLTQYLFGDKKTAEQRRLEEALAMLNRGGL